MQAFVAERRRRQGGFTLIEIMVVVLIIGLLVSIVGPAVMRQLDRGQMSAARTQIASLEASLKLFRTEHFRYPTQEEGLEILTGKATGGTDIDESKLGAILDGNVPKDPWNRAYVYRYPGEHGDFDIFTLGADGQEGGEGVNADIGNWSEDE